MTKLPSQPTDKDSLEVNFRDTACPLILGHDFEMNYWIAQVKEFLYADY